MKAGNRDGPPVLGERPAPPLLDDNRRAEAIDRRRGDDIRPAAEFTAGHLHGTLCIPLIKAFTTWAGWLVAPHLPIALIATPKQARSRRSGRWRRSDSTTCGADSRRPPCAAGGVRQARRGDVMSAEEMRESGRLLVDLREANEFAAGHIPGAEHHPLGTVAAELAGLDRATPLAIHCQGGTRSAIGASVLERMGFTDVIDLNGGYGAWKKR